MVCFAIITPFKSKQYHTDIFSIAQNAGIVNALPTKLRQCFFYGSFKSEPADYFVDIFLSNEAAVNDVLLPVDLIFRDTLREILVLLVQLKHLWCYTKKVDNKKKRRYNRIKRQEEKEMAGTKSPRYSEEFKKTIVNLHQNGKSYAEIEQEYGVSHSALAKWIKQYSAVRLDDDTLITAEQIKSLQKRNAQLEEENLILKKAIAIFTPHSDKD